VIDHLLLPQFGTNTLVHPFFRPAFVRPSRFVSRMLSRRLDWDGTATKTGNESPALAKYFEPNCRTVCGIPDTFTPGARARRGSITIKVFLVDIRSRRCVVFHCSSAFLTLAQASLGKFRAGYRSVSVKVVLSFIWSASTLTYLSQQCS
jgi:hypothetical protein